MTDLTAIHRRVVIADDEAIVRDALAELIDDRPGFAVVGQGASGEDAARLIVEADAEAAIVDVDMPTGGIEAIRLIHERRPGLPVVVFTASRSRSLHRTLRAAGASAIVTKGSAANIVDVVAGLFERPDIAV